MNNNVQVGERIKQIRLSLGESMEKFGERFETSKGTVNNWEKGRNLPNKENLKKISELGQMTVNELLYGNVNNLIESILLGFEFYSFADENKKKRVFELVQKEVKDFPHLLTSDYNDELIEKISDIVVDIINGLDGTNESALRASYEAFSVSGIEDMFYRTVTTSEIEIRYNYSLMMYQKNYKLKKILREGMDEQLYKKLEFVHKQAEAEVTKIARELDYKLYNSDESKKETKKQIFDLIDKIQSIVPKPLRTKKIKKNIDVWVHNNFKELIESPESLSELINTGALKKMTLGEIEPNYIDMTKLIEPDED
ncbi:helix-turn-helix domain-containing protein [Streptococcus suis]|uniref:Transcriptional regulator n=2 Tax=Streptococcus suis TaxID=1307 RepID=A0A123VLY0_STRSU|nr:helix-turn-helix domain-containing protein [Streptococcus suis]MBS8070946.1 helix-turn-helix domain-containing protein [Streptococcus suis]MBS8094079.1 helix-turn-helix domain-containing protein [Streptococcus suis]MBS8102661.1 helix-turn-helix domain-containing protein [Streptococcus suis]MBY4978190.1 helix-turn-helix domain-containing protein [Streptococcus suis]MCK4041229.1 helix-turn-helix domain-containing protein [Streptococcus suis]